MDKKREKKPNGYWTIGRCKAEALQFRTRNEFRRSSARGAAIKLGCLTECTAHMSKQYRTAGAARKKWTRSAIMAIAAKHKTKAMFYKSAAYGPAQAAGILDEAQAHMESGRVFRTDADLVVEALKYKTVAQFKAGNNAAYFKAHATGRFAELAPHLAYSRKQWTRADALALALEYSSRTEFTQAHPGASDYIYKRKFQDQAFAHMAPGLNGFDRTKPGTLYYYEINGLYKLGITNRNVRERVGSQYADIRVLARKRFKIGADASAAECAIRNYVDDCHRYDGPPVLTNGGDTELYTCDILGLDT